MPLEVLAQRDRQRHARALELARLHQLAEGDDLRVGVGDLDAHGAASRDRRHDPDALRAHREGEVIRQVRDLPHLDAGPRLDLELRHHRARRPPHDLGVHTKGGERLLELDAHGVELAVARLRLTRGRRREQVERGELLRRVGQRGRVHLRRDPVHALGGDVRPRLPLALLPSRRVGGLVRRRVRHERGVHRRHLLGRRLARVDDRRIAIPARPLARRSDLGRGAGAGERHRGRPRAHRDAALAPADEHAHGVPGERHHHERAEREDEHDPRADEAEPGGEVERHDAAPDAAQLGPAARRAHRQPDADRHEQHEPGEEDEPGAVRLRAHASHEAERVHRRRERHEDRGRDAEQRRERVA